MPDDLPRPDVSNLVEDASGQVVQAHTIHGGVNFYQAPAAPPAALPLRVGLVPLRAASFQERAVDLLGPVTVLSGLGGVGKTQLAADHAESMWAADRVRFLAWVPATSREAVLSSCADAAAKLTGERDPDPERGARRLLEWLAGTSEPWLVVLDDLREPGDLAGLWPPVGRNGRVVVTTRRRDAALRGHERRLVEVDVFSEDEALTYLRTVVSGQDLMMEGAADLVRELGCLPLALAQAGAYLLDNHLTCAQYRTRFASRSLDHVVPHPNGLPDQHGTTVAATWSLSVELADSMQPTGLARPLLDIASMLDANGIPLGVFTAPAVLGFLTRTTGRSIDKSDAHDGLACLHRLSLITLDTSSDLREVRVQALVQRATRDRWPHDRAAAVAMVAANALGQVWPRLERETVVGQVLRANADALVEVAYEHLWESWCHPVLLRAGESLGDSGLVAEARSYFERLGDTAAKRWGPDHPDTLSIRRSTAHWRGEAGDRTGAASAYGQLVPDHVRVLGPDHPDTMDVRSALADARSKAGDAAGAVTAYERLLMDDIRVFGHEHGNTLVTRHKLANAQGDAGDPTGAVTTLEHLLLDHLRLRGPYDAATLSVRQSIAFWLAQAGDHKGAIRAAEQLLRDQELALGPDHPDTLPTRNNLGVWWGRAGDPSAAVATFEQLLPICLRVLGPDHPGTRTVQKNLRTWQQTATDGTG